MIPSYDMEQKGISVLIPCYNEALILRYTIKGLLNLNYNNLEVIFINDGSVDSTFDVLYELLELKKVNRKNGNKKLKKIKGIYVSQKYPYMYVIDKYNDGKGNSLRVATYYAKQELIVTMDGDCILEKNALININSSFVDEDVIASGGVVHIMQMFKLESGQRRIILMQSLDYLKGFYIYKTSLAYNNALSIISGAFGVFNKEILIKVGGFRTGLGEDIDVTLRFQEYAKKNNKKVVFNRDAICYTECPENIRELARQRIRWQKGFIDAILSNSSFLISNLFKSSVSFFIIIDALLSNTFGTIVFITNLILLALKVIYSYPIETIIYFITTILFNIISSMIAINQAKKTVPHLKTKLLYKTIIYDILIFQFLRIYFFIEGTVTYFIDDKRWNKVNRTNNTYNL